MISESPENCHIGLVLRGRWQRIRDTIRTVVPQGLCALLLTDSRSREAWTDIPLTSQSHFPWNTSWSVPGLNNSSDGAFATSPEKLFYSPVDPKRCFPPFKYFPVPLTTGNAWCLEYKNQDERGKFIPLLCFIFPQHLGNTQHQTNLSMGEGKSILALSKVTWSAVGKRNKVFAAVSCQ